MEWSHTHFDGYELLAVPSDSPASIVILDSSALVLVQRVLLPEGDAPPRALTWQPGGASTGCSSGALSCIVSTRGRNVWRGGRELVCIDMVGIATTLGHYHVLLFQSLYVSYGVHGMYHYV